MRVPSLGHMTQWDTPGMQSFFRKLWNTKQVGGTENIFVGPQSESCTCIVCPYVCNANKYLSNLTSLDQSTVNELSFSNECRCINLP